MAFDRNHATEEAFRQLRLSLVDIVDQFRAWAEISKGTPASLRMRKLIADHVALAVDQYLTDMIAFIDKANDTSLQSIEMILSTSVHEMNLSARIRLQDLDHVIQWAEKELPLMLDLSQYLEYPERPNKFYQRIRRTSESAINLRFAYNRELQQEEVDREFSRVQDELRMASDGRRDLESSLQRVSELTQRIEELNAESSARNDELNKYQKMAEQAEQSFTSVQAQQEVLNEEESKNALIEHFQKFHDDHDGKATMYFAVGISVLCAVAIFAVIYAFLMADKTVNWPVLTWKLAVVAGGSAIGTYLLRQSTYHRSLSVWSSTVRVQLQTFAPYIQLIGEESARDQLRMEFARRVFGNEPGTVEKNPEPASNTAAVAELANLVANITKLQSSSTPKGNS